MLRETIRKLPGVPLLIALNTILEDWWFDWRHNTETSADHNEQAREGSESDPENHPYIPIRPKRARRVLSALPVEDPSEYTFIDFGCGKGRMLVMASALPFRRIIGVELLKDLCDRATLNLKTNHRTANRDVKCVNINAMDFEFPADKMVLYFFNPFGEDVMRAVLQNLDRSLDSSYRDVIIALDTPDHAAVADGMPHLSFLLAGYGYKIYRSRDVRFSVAER